MRDFYPAIILTFSVLLVIVCSSLMPPSRGAVLVFFSPFETQSRQLGAIIGADALLVAPGRLAGSFIVASDADGLPERLIAHGALLVVNPYGATGCTPPDSRWLAFAAADTNMVE